MFIITFIIGGEYKCSTVHVDNICEGIELGIQRGIGGEKYFFTDGEPVIFKDYISKMLQTQGVEPPTSTIPYALVYAAAAASEWGCWALNKLGIKKEPVITRQVSKWQINN